METLEKLARLAAILTTIGAAVISIYAGYRFIRERTSADFHYRRSGRKRGMFRIMEFGWHMRRGATLPVRVHARVS